MVGTVILFHLYDPNILDKLTASNRQDCPGARINVLEGTLTRMDLRQVAATLPDTKRIQLVARAMSQDVWVPSV